ncbi:galaxin-like isoform X5 [Puntigrus tetrazona]|uniref:galaxin-like isoform X5 n=1 Tax=Puntigrus tetrazona TaxID=1606681 RepID=UPI001C8AFF16|nr:galaxin-like isoform X5 [Puntigrus tetrazona]
MPARPQAWLHGGARLRHTGDVATPLRFLSIRGVVTILCIFAASSANGVCNHDRGSHCNAGFSGQMEGSHHLCGNVFYKISESSCCNDNITLGLSQLVADCCGSVAYNPLNEICCNGRILTRSSTHQKCCGENMYVTTTHVCCGGNNILQRKENHACCGKETFDVTTHCCCANPELEVKPKNEACCPKATDCPSACTLSETYNPHEICCSGKLHKKASALTKCCGVDAYTLSDDNVLCCNGILHINVPEHSECVGGVIYSPENTTCQMSTRPRLGEHCCGGQTFNPHTHICCNGHSHNKKDGNFCCGSEVYDHRKKFLRCCSGHLYNLTHLHEKAECCGNLLLQYNNNQTCCSSATNSIIYETKPNHRCCGHYYYNTSLWSCCAEHLKPTPKPNSSPAEYRLKPLMDLIPEMCKETVFFGKVESVALKNDQRHVVLKVVGQVDVKSEKVIKDPWLHVSLDHCSSPATENNMTYLWENRNGTHKLLSHPVDLTSDIHMLYSVCYQKKG